ncbi:MAG: efflux RND transporter periplasmic adaptor subunit [Myxococcota bacterium]
MKKSIMKAGFFVVCILFLGVLTQCDRESSQPLAEATTETTEEKHVARGPSSEKEEKEEEVSDLDRPLEELFSETCEHKKLTYQCDICRYEIGVVKVEQSLIEKGLIKLGKTILAPFEEKLSLTGEIQFNKLQTAALSPPVSGRLTEVFVDIGDEVKKSSRLFKIESFELAEAESEYLKTKALFSLAKSDYERQTKLREAKINSEREFLNSSQSYEITRIQLNNAAQKLVRLGLMESDIAALGNGDSHNNLGRLTFRSPVSGTILQIKASLGEWVTADREVFVVGDISTLWVWVDIHEKDLKKVMQHYKRNDLRTVVEVDAFEGEEFLANLDSIAVTMDETSRTVKARVSIENHNKELRPGMFAYIKVYLPRSDNVIIVPKTAVLSDERRDFVFIRYKEDYYVRREVLLGERFAESVEVKKGLKVGDEIVIGGSFLLKSDVLRSKMGAGCAD